MVSLSFAVLWGAVRRERKNRLTRAGVFLYWGNLEGEIEHVWKDLFVQRMLVFVLHLGRAACPETSSKGSCKQYESRLKTPRYLYDTVADW